MSEFERSTLSVILPNYNDGRFVGRAVNELLAQDRQPDEIIIVDDCSTDDSLHVIETLLSQSHLVRLLANQTNKGVIYSQMRGLEASSGKYVYLAAADDWVLPDFFGTALRLLECYPAAGMACGESSLVSSQTGRSIGTRPAVRPSTRMGYLPPEAVAVLLKTADNLILTGSTIFVSERMLTAGGLLPELGSFADGYLTRKLALMHGFCYIPRPVATWQVSEESFSRKTAFDPERAEKVLRSALIHIEKDRCFPRWYGELFRRRWQFGIARLAVIANTINDAVLFRVFAGSRLDVIVLSVLRRVWPTAIARPMLLAWLWLRLSPMSLWPLFITYFERRFQRANKPRASFS